MSTNPEGVNLENCAREPIHIPGAIQPHGLLFVLREPQLTVVQVSENVSTFLGRSVESILNHDLSTFLSEQQVERVRFALESLDPKDNNPVDLQLETRNGVGSLDGFVHRHNGLSFLELEPASVAYSSRFLEFYKTISKLTTRLHTTPTLSSLLENAATGIREMTGFDRIMIYRFADNFEGEVVAEAKSPEVDPFLGLWFPASDIPEQARRLYVANPIRAIMDSRYEPASILPVMNPDTGAPADLSHAGLRSVSPIHCEYLQNMGVAASMSVSIIREDRLWGLIAGHHRTPRLVPYELRKACTFIGQVMSSEIGRRESEAETAYFSQATVTQGKFLELMAGAANPLLGLIHSSPNLLDFIPCAGAAIVGSGKADMLGFTPGYVDIMKLVERLQAAGLASTFHTSALKNHFSVTEALRTSASGLIALQVERDPATYVLFFRPEVTQTVSWGGNPEKPVEASEDGFRMSPRKSFEKWQEEVHGHSLPWTPLEIKASAELRNLISVVLYSTAERRTAI
jgi:chemotaxis family two-component system sensor kinase Cph1